MLRCQLSKGSYPAPMVHGGRPGNCHDDDDDDYDSDDDGDGGDHDGGGGGDNDVESVCNVAQFV